MNEYIIILLSFCLAGCVNTSENINTSKKGEVLDYLEQKMRDEGIPGLQIAVLRNNEIVFTEELGYSNVPFKVEVNKNTLFPICSLSKLFAATAIMQLEEQKKLKLSDEIGLHLSDLPNAWDAVTIKQLLSHTSGIPDIEDPNDDQLIDGKDQVAAWLAVKKMPIQFQPGEEFSYNATNYLLIQKIIEKYSAAPYNEYVEDSQFDVAGMDLVYYGNSADVIENKAPTYLYYYKDPITNEYVKGEDLLEINETFPSNFWTDSGAHTNVTDLAKWIIALQKDKLLTERSKHKMWKPVVLNNGAYGGFDDALNGYGLGWPVAIRDNHPALIPTGGGRCAIAIYPEDNLAVILLTNLTGILTHEIVDDIGKIYLK